MFRIGSKVKISKEGAENDLYADFVDMILKVTSVSRSVLDHPGYDPGAGVPLYDLETLEGKHVPFSLYLWELRKA